jgi:SH3 domain protein
MQPPHQVVFRKFGQDRVIGGVAFMRSPADTACHSLTVSLRLDTLGKSVRISVLILLLPDIAGRSVIKAVFLVVMLIPTAYADTVRYVSDNMEIQLRSGKTFKHAILKTLPSGMPVTVIQADPDGYSRVRTRDGVEGWVLTRYLSSVPSARDRLAEAEQRLAAFKIENTQLKEQLKALAQQKTDAEKQRQEWVETSRRVNQELNSVRQTAASSLEIDHENKMMKSRLVSLERDLQTLQQENGRLKDRAARDWFVLGAAVVLVGLIIGLILPKLRWRRRSSWQSF